MEDAKKEPKAKTKNPTKKKKVISIIVLVVGVIVLAVGVVFLVLNLMKMNRAKDGEFLVSSGAWVLDDSRKVVWDFTEIGKGTLTTNDHLNDYNFAWAIKDDKLLIETDWLYELENEYDYSLNKGAKELTLTDKDGKTYKFTAQQ